MQTTIKKLSNDHETWKSDLAFYRDEIKFFRGKLDEVAKANNVHPIIEKIEHFQNVFDIHDSKLSGIKHDIEQYTHDVYQDGLSHANHITAATAEKYESLKDKMSTTAKLHTDLKEEFKSFLQKVL